MLELYMLCTTVFEYDQQSIHGEVTKLITATKLMLYNMSGIVCKMVKVQNQKAQIYFQLKLNQTAHSEVC